jgi:hypothetical protein
MSVGEYDVERFLGSRRKVVFLKDCDKKMVRGERKFENQVNRIENLKKGKRRRWKYRCQDINLSGLKFSLFKKFSCLRNSSLF